MTANSLGEDATIQDDAGFAWRKKDGLTKQNQDFYGVLRKTERKVS